MLSMMMLMTGGGGEQQGSPFTMLLFFAMIFVVFYLLIIRPQRKRQQEHQKMLESVQTGDRVLTSGGLLGNVVGTKEVDGIPVIVVKIADNTKVEVSRSHVQQILEKNR